MESRQAPRVTALPRGSRDLRRGVESRQGGVKSMKGEGGGGGAEARRQANGCKGHPWSIELGERPRSLRLSPPAMLTSLGLAPGAQEGYEPGS